MKGTGAKARMARLQGRKEYECELCGEDGSVSECATCGRMLCRDCRMDHECVIGAEEGVKGEK